jgi:FlaA1/EpsC-like NDP-sugar epimerase
MTSGLRNRHLLLLDGLQLLCTPAIAYTLRFEGLGWLHADAPTAVLYTLLATPLKLFVFLVLGLYARIWRQADLRDAVLIGRAAAVAAAACALLGLRLLTLSGLTGLRVPLSVVALDACLTCLALVLPRLLVKARGAHPRPAPRAGRRALVVGAGAAGELIVRELAANPQIGLLPVGFVDDDPQKHAKRLCGLPVLGPLADIPILADRLDVEELVIAMPTATGAVVRRVLEAADAAGIHTRTIPGLFDILSERVGVSQLRRVEIQDLLRREPVHTDLDAVRALVAGRTVLVTGAGGSIGSELCRQVACLQPARLVLLGHGENSIFEIRNELRRTHPGVPAVPVIADVRDMVRLDRVVREHVPHVVFHAAAHKHVPLMEENVAEAVLNNVLGTRNLLAIAEAAGIGHLVFVSSDKAVRPNSVMGATKRVGELLVQRTAQRIGREFVVVRFGNVLGSRGSVVPIFLRQIEAGGPVLVTHPEMRRFFMTISEAVQLVLQAAVLGHGGEVLVLDMGEPVKIVDLARDLVRLSGAEAARRIEIRYSGLRPGERLLEELLAADETPAGTSHAKIFRARSTRTVADLDAVVDTLVAAASAGCPEPEVRTLLRTIAPDLTGCPDACAPLASTAPAPPAPAVDDLPSLELFGRPA